MNSMTRTAKSQNKSSELSPFAHAIRRLLDDTDYFTRAEWARFLGVTTSALSQWANDKTVPRADLLRVILDALRSSAGVPPGPLAEFDQVARLPAQEASPLGSRMLPTVEDYLAKGTFLRLGRELRGLTADQQQKVLAEGSWGSIQDQSRLPARAAQMDDVDTPVHASALGKVAVDAALLPHLQRTETRDGAPHNARVSWDSLLTARAAIIVGEPGCGKSTLMGALAEAFRERLNVAPVVISARSPWSQEKGFWLSHASGVDSSARNPILVDGLDEIPATSLASTVEELNRAALREGAQVFVTSRPVPQLAHLKGFDLFSVGPLTNLQVVLWLKRAQEQGNELANIKQGTDELERFVCHFFERRTLKHRSFRNPLFLHTAWTLFARNGITPFAEAEVAGEFARRLLYEWDRDRNLVRAREPWAAPHRLSAMLGEICSQLVTADKTEFGTRDAEKWIGTRTQDVPCNQLLALLSVQSGIFRESGPDCWRVTNDYFRHYFAAVHAVESSTAAIQYFDSWGERDDVRDVVRMACGITSDATALLRGVLNARDVKEAERCALLAHMLAQPVTAAGDVVAQSCHVMVRWLDKVLEGWHLVKRSPSNPDEPETLWEIKATTNATKDYDSRVTGVLGAMHQARSGPAKGALRDNLERAKTPVLPAFATSLDVEGQFRLHSEPLSGERFLRATVVAAPG